MASGQRSRMPIHHPCSSLEPPLMLFSISASLFNFLGIQNCFSTQNLCTCSRYSSHSQFPNLDTTRSQRLLLTLSEITSFCIRTLCYFLKAHLNDRRPPSQGQGHGNEFCLYSLNNSKQEQSLN